MQKFEDKRKFLTSLCCLTWLLLLHIYQRMWWYCQEIPCPICLLRSIYTQWCVKMCLIVPSYTRFRAQEDLRFVWQSLHILLGTGKLTHWYKCLLTYPPTLTVSHASSFMVSTGLPVLMYTVYGPSLCQSCCGEGSYGALRSMTWVSFSHGFGMHLWLSVLTESRPATSYSLTSTEQQWTLDLTGMLSGRSSPGFSVKNPSWAWFTQQIPPRWLWSPFQKRYLPNNIYLDAHRPER